MSTFYQAVQQIRLHTSGRLTCHPRTYAILAVFISYEVKHTNTIQCQETAAKLKEKEGEKKKNLAPLSTNTHNRFLDHPTRLRLAISGAKDRLCGAAGILNILVR